MTVAAGALRKGSSTTSLNHPLMGELAPGTDGLAGRRDFQVGR
jgi:hypothetical protein